VAIVVLIALVETFFTLLKAPKISYENIDARSQQLIPKIDSNSILFLGDSRIAWGIKPNIIKNRM